MNEQWLKIQFKKNPQKTKSGLARALGLEPPAVSKILNGDRQIKAREYAVMRQYFGLAMEDISAVQKNYRLQNFRTALDLLEKTYHDGRDDWFVPASILEDKVKAPEKIKIFTVEDDLMAPDYNRGDSVLVDLLDKNPDKQAAYVVSDGFGAMVRACERIENKETEQVRVSAKSSAFPSTVLNLDDFKILGRVIAKLQWL